MHKEKFASWRKEIQKISLVIFFLLIFFEVQKVNAQIVTPWSENFDSYPDGILNGGNVINDLTSGATRSCSSGQFTQLTSDAAYGGSGKGIRFWHGGQAVPPWELFPGKNDGSGNVIINLATPVNEIWVRFYKRYQYGFTWLVMDEEKVLLFSDGEGGAPVIFSGAVADKFDNFVGAHKYDTWKFWNQDHMDPFENVYGESNTGWVATQGSAIGDGLWHIYEIHIKKQSGDLGTDGAEEFWVDGVLKMSRKNLNLGTAWPKKHMAFEVNLSQVGDTGIGCFYIDIDNIAISTNPTNRDAENNPFIGPIVNVPVTFSISNFTTLISNWLHLGTVSDFNADNIINTKDLGVMMSKWQ